MDSLITSDWNGFGFKLIEKSDYPAVIGHLQENYYLDESIQVCLGVPITKERVADLDETISDILDVGGQGSFYAYPLDQPSKVAAVMIVCIHDKARGFPIRKVRSPLSLKFRATTMPLKIQYDVHKERGLHVFPELYIVSTDKSCRGKGLATEMFRKSIAYLTAQENSIVYAIYTSPYSRMIGNKLGFKEVSRVNFIDVKDENGSRIFPEATSENFATGAVLDLQ